MLIPIMECRHLKNCEKGTERDFGLLRNYHHFHVTDISDIALTEEQEMSTESK
jgi:hypothetical protein